MSTVSTVSTVSTDPSRSTEEWCAWRGARWGAGGAACAEAGLLRSHLAYRLATVLAADLAENLICSWLEDVTVWLRKQIFAYFEHLSGSPSADVLAHVRARPLCVEETCRVILEKIPETYLFSEHTLSAAVRLVVASLAHKDVNKDVVYRALDVYTVHFRKSAGLRNPSFDSN